VDPLSEGALLASLLRAQDVPTDMTIALGPETLTQSDTIGYNENKGIRIARQQFDGSDTVTAAYDIRWQFPTKSTARAFLKADNDLSEVDSSGLVLRTNSPGFGDESLTYAGTVDGKTVFNYLIRVKNVLGKVYLEGTAGLDADTADDLADAAAFQMEQAIEGPYPTADETAVLNSVPPDIAGSCGRVFEIYLAESESIRCRPSGLPVTDYTLFPAQKQMDAAFDADLKDNGNPVKGGSCSTGRYINGYAIAGVHAGRLMCVTQDKTRVIEWTDEQLFILSYASSTTLSWDDLYAYWNNNAGPDR
jgi:hypothetical protein